MRGASASSRSRTLRFEGSDALLKRQHVLDATSCGMCWGSCSPQQTPAYGLMPLCGISYQPINIAIDPVAAWAQAKKK